MPYKLKNFAIDRVDLVDEGANQHAHVLITKAFDERDGEYEKANMTAGERNALPDSAFAAVWTDKDGKKQRKLAYQRKDGSIDLGHLRNARSRIAQHPDIPESVKATAQRKLDAAAKEHGVGKLNKRQASQAAMKRFMSMIAKAFGGDGQPAGDDEDGEDEYDEDGHPVDKMGDGEMHPKALEATKALHEHLGKMIEQHKGADGGFGHLPADHPVHKLVATHKALGETLDAYGKQPGDGGLANWEHVPDEGGPEPYGREPSNRNALTKRAQAEIAKANAEVEKARKDAEEAKAIAKKLQDDAAVAKARVTVAKFASLGVDVEKDALVMKSLEETAPETYKRVCEILGGAEALVSKSRAFDTIGTDRTGSGDAWAKIEALAAELVSKGAGKVTKHKAIDQVMKARPDL